MRETREISQGTELHMECPICSDLQVRPRIYPACGHSICELCHIKSDMSMCEDSYGRQAFSGGRCPSCRTPCIGPWHSRPLNHSLIQCILESDMRPKYEQVEEKLQQDIKEMLAERLLPGASDDAAFECEPETNIAEICRAARDKRVKQLLREIQHVVYDAACEGQPSLVVTVNSRELFLHARHIAPRLIRWGAFSVECTPHEFVINILEEATLDTQSTFQNPSYATATVPRVDRGSEEELEGVPGIDDDEF